MAYNLTSAAAAAGINKSTVWRAIRAGKVSAQRDANGQWTPDPAEFHRVFPPLPCAATEQPVEKQQDAMADAMIAELRLVIADLRSDRDHWRAAFESTQRLLPSPTPRRAMWWQWPRTTG